MKFSLGNIYEYKFMNIKIGSFVYKAEASARFFWVAVVSAPIFQPYFQIVKMTNKIIPVILRSYWLVILITLKGISKNTPFSISNWYSQNLENNSG